MNSFIKLKNIFSIKLYGVNEEKKSVYALVAWIMVSMCYIVGIYPFGEEYNLVF